MIPQANVQNGRKRSTTGIAFLVTMLWCAACAGLYVLYPEMAQDIVQNHTLMAFFILGFCMPLIIIWIITLIVKPLGRMQHEVNILNQSLEYIRQTLEIRIAEEAETRDHWIQKQLVQITTLIKQTDNRLSVITEESLSDEKAGQIVRKTAALPQKTPITDDTAQAALPLPDSGTLSNDPITVDELIKALNFPINAQDEDGFRILRRAFNDPTISIILKSAQDVLTLLSEDGIFMDDLETFPPAAQTWRNFAKGERGAGIAEFNHIRDQSVLSFTKRRLKNDTVFREVVHRFLTRFDNILAEFEKTAKDSELMEMGKTRSAIAFMLLGSISGAFEPR